MAPQSAVRVAGRSPSTKCKKVGIGMGGDRGDRQLVKKREHISMSEILLADIARKLKKIDFCMTSTHGGSGAISNHPMSNNGDVKYDGDSWFFSHTDNRAIGQGRCGLGV